MELIIFLFAVALWIIGAIIKGVSKAYTAAKNSWDSQNAPINYRPVPQDQSAPVASPTQTRPAPPPLMERLPEGLQNAAKEMLREFDPAAARAGNRPPPKAPPPAVFGTYPGAVTATTAVTQAPASAPQAAKSRQASSTRAAEVERQAGDIQALAQAPVALPAVIGLSRERDQWLKAIILQEALGPPLSRRRKPH